MSSSWGSDTPLKLEDVPGLSEEMQAAQVLGLPWGMLEGGSHGQGGLRGCRTDGVRETGVLKLASALIGCFGRLLVLSRRILN
jgi:hypothetical protein